MSAPSFTRSARAVAAGFVAVVVLSLGTDAALHAAGVFPPWGQTMSDGLFALASVYRAVFTVVGGWVTVRLAPDRPMRHAWILGGIGLVAAVAGAAATWNQPELGPRWYPLSLVVTAIPCTWLGGRIALASRPPAR